MDPNIRDAVLRDPRVQEAVRNAGKDALSKPAVQQHILEACRQKFPEIAAAAQAKILEWANDAEVQQQAYAYAGIAAQYTRHTVGQVTSLIEQGPAGLRVLAFGSGAACCVNAALFMFGVLDPASAVSQLVVYVLHSYLIAFALTTMLFEAKPEWIQMFAGLDMYQNMLLSKAQFLSEVLGRGLFYGFQGTLWLSFASISALQNYLLGLWLLLMAVLHICMHFGVMPHEVVAKLKIREQGYRPLCHDEGEGQHLPEGSSCADESDQELTHCTLKEEPSGAAAEPARAGSAREPLKREERAALQGGHSVSPRDEAEERLLASLQAPAEQNAVATKPARPAEPIQGRGEGDPEGGQPSRSSRAKPPKAKACCAIQ